MKQRRPSQYTRRERSRRKRKILMISFLMMIIVVNFVWIINHPFLRIKTIHISGNETILTQDIESKLSSLFKKKNFFIFPRDSILFIRPKALARKIKNTFPRIYSANARIIDGNIFELKLEEREPHSLWCKNKVYKNSFDEECFFADQRGYLYSHAPYFSQGVFEKIYMNPDSLAIGEEVLNKKDFSEFFEFVDSLEEEHKMFFTQFVMDESESVKLYFGLLQNIPVEQNPALVYYNTSSYEDLKEQMRLLLNTKKFKREFKKRPQDLLLLDFRIPNQIRYKFKPIQKDDDSENT